MKHANTQTTRGELDECDHNECDTTCTMKHTPGPWKQDGCQVEAEFNSDGTCTLIGEFDSFEDAALIAAAPEMLEALEFIMKHELLKNEAAIKALDALAKARGEK